jgi:hypothetical protein
MQNKKKKRFLQTDSLADTLFLTKKMFFRQKNFFYSNKQELYLKKKTFFFAGRVRMSPDAI